MKFTYPRTYWYLVLLHPLSYIGITVILKTTIWNGLSGRNATNFIGAAVILFLLLLGLFYMIVEIVSFTPMSFMVENKVLIGCLVFKKKIQIPFSDIHTIDLTIDRTFYDFEIRYKGGVLRGSNRLKNLHELVRIIKDEHPECELKN